MTVNSPTTPANSCPIFFTHLWGDTPRKACLFLSPSSLPFSSEWLCLQHSMETAFTLSTSIVRPLSLSFPASIWHKRSLFLKTLCLFSLGLQGTKCTRSRISANLTDCAGSFCFAECAPSSCPQRLECPRLRLQKDTESHPVWWL